MKKLFLLGYALISLLSLGCVSDVICPNQQEGVILGPLSHCDYLIKLDNGSWLDPTNIEDFIDLETTRESQIRVRVSFHEVAGGSYCMMGSIIEIDCLTEL